MPKDRNTLTEFLADRPIAYHPVLAKITGKLTAGVLLGQLLYWDKTMRDAALSKHKTYDGWFWKASRELYEETGLNRGEFETARKLLVLLGLVETKVKGVPATTFYHVKIDALITALEAHGENVRRELARGDHGRFAKVPQSSLRESRKLDCEESADSDCEDPANWIAEGPQAIHEITQETTPTRLPEEAAPAGAPASDQAEAPAPELSPADPDPERPPEPEYVPLDPAVKLETITQLCREALNVSSLNGEEARLKALVEEIPDLDPYRRAHDAMISLRRYSFEKFPFRLFENCVRRFVHHHQIQEGLSAPPEEPL